MKNILNKLIIFCIPGSAFLYSTRTYFAFFVPWVVILWIYIQQLLPFWISTESLLLLLFGFTIIHIYPLLHLYTGKQWQQIKKPGKARRINLWLFAASILSATLTAGFFKENILPLRIYRVEATSMLPTLRPGDLVFVDLKHKTISKGDIIVFSHPSIQGMHMIKRISSISHKEVEVLGDNLRTSIDSRIFGGLPKRYIIGVAKMHIRNRKFIELKKLRKI